MEGYIGCCFFLCPVTDISATVAQIGVKFNTSNTYRSRQKVSLLGGGTHQDPKTEILDLNFGHLTAYIPKNGKPQLYMSIRT